MVEHSEAPQRQPRARVVAVVRHHDEEAVRPASPARRGIDRPQDQSALARCRSARSRPRAARSHAGADGAPGTSLDHPLKTASRPAASVNRFATRKRVRQPRRRHVERPEHPRQIERGRRHQDEAGQADAPLTGERRVCVAERPGRDRDRLGGRRLDSARWRVQRYLIHSSVVGLCGEGLEGGSAGDGGAVGVLAQLFPVSSVLPDLERRSALGVDVIGRGHTHGDRLRSLKICVNPFVFAETHVAAGGGSTQANAVTPWPSSVQRVSRGSRRTPLPGADPPRFHIHRRRSRSGSGNGFGIASHAWSEEPFATVKLLPSRPTRSTTRRIAFEREVRTRRSASPGRCRRRGARRRGSSPPRQRRRALQEWPAAPSRPRAAGQCCLPHSPRAQRTLPGPLRACSMRPAIASDPAVGRVSSISTTPDTRPACLALRFHDSIGVVGRVCLVDHAHVICGGQGVHFDRDRFGQDHVLDAGAVLERLRRERPMDEPHAVVVVEPGSVVS